MSSTSGPLPPIVICEGVDSPMVGGDPEVDEPLGEFWRRTRR